ncbi:MAG: hypothetical protein P8J37_14925 [Fuerstiella sp.]|nr:hypothetical protein [Fuerstiella sp.]
MRTQSYRRISILIACGILVPAIAMSTRAQEPPSRSVAAPQTSREFSAADVVAIQNYGQAIGVADWLGPLAPVALSPFFGITCLSAMALYGQDWFAADNALLREGSPLQDPVFSGCF